MTVRALPRVFGSVGMPLPRSMNWLIPCPAAHLVALARNCLFSRITSAEMGTTASSFCATSRSTAKLSLPFQQVVINPGDGGRSGIKVGHGTRS